MDRTVDPTPNLMNGLDVGYSPGMIGNQRPAWRFADSVSAKVQTPSGAWPHPGRSATVQLPTHILAIAAGGTAAIDCGLARNSLERLPASPYALLGRAHKAKAGGQKA